MLELRLIQDLEIAQSIWEKLSPQESLYDLWAVRLCFYQNNPQPLFFYTYYENDEPVAVLPLEYNKRKNFLQFLAEDFIEGNKPFFKSGYEYLLPELFGLNFPYPVKIYDLEPTSDFISQLPLEDYTYYYDLTDINSFDDFLLKAFPNGRKRYNFKRLFPLLEKEHQVQVIYDDFTNLPKLMELNICHFKKESYLKTKKEQQAFFDLIKLPLDFKMVSIATDGRLLAHSLSVIYKNIYYYLIVGSDVSEVKEVFKYLTKVNMELAIKAKAKIFDCSLGDCNWKKFWHLATKTQHKFEKNV
ncbi:MAG: hypothetical protein ACOX0H_01235 [Patescibacteria group bacterium]|jgi:hypothetical protein|nr:hypothetical protein [bacterium]HQC49516.1 hypothetical protein [bacterium]